MIRRFCYTAATTTAIALWSVMAGAQTSTPIVSDSRIKTFVYNENDVFSVLTHYGYQSNIEFGKHEVIQTVSVGDRVAWQIVPAGQRLFIKALEEKAHTNMTVVTNKRAYQFDLRSSGRQPLHPSEELVYVVRFFYPEMQPQVPNPPIFSDQPIPVSLAQPTVPAGREEVASMPAASMGLSQQPIAATPPPPASLNYHYTLSGPETIAPVRVYDDGVSTYLTFDQADGRPVRFYALQPGGQPVPVPASRNARGEYVVNTVQPRLLVESGGQQVVVYNEAMPSA